MPRYFFDTIDNGKVIHDDIGIDLPDDAAARKYVGKILPDLAHKGLPDGDIHTFGCTARNEAREKVYYADLTYKGQHITSADT